MRKIGEPVTLKRKVSANQVQDIAANSAQRSHAGGPSVYQSQLIVRVAVQQSRTITQIIADAHTILFKQRWLLNDIRLRGFVRRWKPYLTGGQVPPRPQMRCHAKECIADANARVVTIGPFKGIGLALVTTANRLAAITREARQL